MGATLYLARRLSLSSGGKKSSPAVRVAITAVAMSVIVMMWAVAVVTGFKTEISTKVSGFNSHLSISPDPDSNDSNGDAASGAVMTLTPTLKSMLDDVPYITDYALQVSIPAIFKTNDDFKGIYLKSLSGSALRRFIESSIIEGRIPDYNVDSCRNHIAVSRKAADQLGLHPGDVIDTYFISDAIRARRLKVAAVFDSHFDAFDDSFAYSSLSLIQELGNLSPNQGTSLALTTDDLDNVTLYAADLQRHLFKTYADQTIYRPYAVSSARQSGAAYFQWLSLLDMNVIVVLILMTVVATITLISGMLILMVDMIRFIALIGALGASRRQISRIFMLMAARIAIYGLLIGDITGISLLILQAKSHFIPLDPDSYYIDFVPVEISIPAILIMNICVLAIIFISLAIPSRFAGKAAPARTLASE